MKFLLLALVVIAGVASQDPTGNPLVDVQIGAEAIHQMYEATFDNVRFYSSDILNDQNNDLLGVALDAISSWSQLAQSIASEDLTQVTCGCANCNGAASCGCTSCGCNAQASTECGCTNCANQNPANNQEITSNCNGAATCGCTSCGCNAANNNAEASTGCGANAEGVTANCGCTNCNAAGGCGCTSGSCGCTSGTCGNTADAQNDQPINCGPANEEEGVTANCGGCGCNAAQGSSCGCTSCGCNAAQNGGCGAVNVELTDDDDKNPTDVEVATELRNCNCRPRCVTPPTGPVPVEDLIKKRIDMFYTEAIGVQVQACVNNARTLLMARHEAILEAIELGRYKSTELQLKAVNGLLDFNLLVDFDSYYETMTPLIYEYYNHLVNVIDPQLEILVGELEYNRDMLTTQMRGCLQDITGK